MICCASEGTSRSANVAEKLENNRRRKRERRLAGVAHRFKFGTLAVHVLRQPIFTDFGFKPVDVEVIPSFDGSPKDMFAWLIFATGDEASRAGEKQMAGRLLERARENGFPADAVSSFSIYFTSIPEIEAGGGRFYFFR